MSHSYTSADVIRRREEELASYQSSINRSQLIARGDGSSFEALKQQVRDFLETSKDKKNQALDLEVFEEIAGIDGKIRQRIRLPAESQERIAILNRGQEKSFEIILNLMENPQESISYYEANKKIIEDELKELKKLEVR